MLRLLLASLLLAALLAGCQDVNHPPSVALVGDQWVLVGERLEVTLAGTDPDGDRLDFDVEGLPEAAELTARTPSTAFLLWSPSITDTQAGGRTYDVRVTASDGHGGQASLDFTVTVFPVFGVPRFDLPAGTVLDLADARDLTLPVEVKDDDSTTVDISLAEAPEGAKLSASGPKSALLYWEPTDGQRLLTVHRFVFRAEDEAHPPVEHTLLVVLVHAEEGAGCVGSPPTVEHVPPADATLQDGGLPIETRVTDADSTVTSVTVQWTDGASGSAPKTLPLTRDEADKTRWYGTLEPEAVPPGGAALHYHLSATDNDDATGVACDRTARFPKTGWLTAAVYPPGAPADACVDDDAEPDDALATAPTLAAGLYAGRRLCGTAPDLGRIELPGGGGVVARVTRVPSHGDVVVLLKDAEGNVVDVGTGDEPTLVVSEEVPGAAVRFVEVVAADAPVALSYTLDVSVTQAPCPEDVLEPNDAPAEAAESGPGAWTDLALCPGDEDWLRVPLQAGDRLEVDLDFQHAFGDLDLEVLAADGETVLAASTGLGSGESVSHDATAAGPVLVRVLGYQGASNAYDLEIRVTAGGGACEEDILGVHDAPGAAVPLFAGIWENLVACPGHPDWYAVDLNGGETVDLLVENLAEQGSLDLALFTDPDGAPVATSSAAPGDLADASHTLAGEGRLWYRVESGSPAGYALLQEVTDPAGPCGDDRFEPNDGPAEAAPVEPGVLTWLRLCGDEDVDAFRVEVEAFRTLSVLTSHAEGAGYTDVTILPPGATSLDDELASQLDYGPGVTLDVLAEEAGAYTVVVTPFEADALPYDLAILVE